MTGKEWTAMREPYKATYLLAFFEGLAMGQIVSDVGSKGHKKIKDAYGDWQLDVYKLFVDQFYQDALNINIPISDALMFVKFKTVNQPSKVDERLQRLRHGFPAKE